jgi:hypothetical protein
MWLSKSCCVTTNYEIFWTTLQLFNERATINIYILFTLQFLYIFVLPFISILKYLIVDLFIIVHLFVILTLKIKKWFQNYVWLKMWKSHKCNLIY